MENDGLLLLIAFLKAQLEMIQMSIEANNLEAAKDFLDKEYGAL